MKVLHVLVCLHICADYAHMTKTSSGSVAMETEWGLFKDTYNKSYSDNEDGYRFSLWKNNLKKIFQHNSEADAGIHTYRLAMNQLGDMTEEELSHLHGLRVNSVNDTVARDSASTVVPSDDVTLPDEIDWRKHGYVTPVKSQGHCGACYTFATTGALEGQHFRKTGKLISLSEQNLLDCSATYGNKGCVGGLMDNAYRYIIHNRGVDTEKDYPYKAEVEKCKYKPRERGATCKGFRDLPKGNEKALLSAVGGIGPVSVGIDATSFTFFFYSGGVYDNIWCSSEKLSHGVLVVGYGRENGQDFWLVKNSWGQDWGVKGYIKMARNKNNQCGIATLASYPIV